MTLICQKHLVLTLKNCKPELSNVPTELFNMSLQESCFSDCWKVSSVVLVFRNIRERFPTRKYHPISLFTVVSKAFEKQTN